MVLKDFQILEKLGEGAFSAVHKVKRRSDGKLYALKRIKISTLQNDKERETTMNEIRFLASIHHPNIIGYREAFIHNASNELCIVEELASRGDLSLRIKRATRQRLPIPEKEVWSLFIQLCSGLYALHSLDILHRDIKPANCFMADDGTVKIGDLNVAKIMQKGLLMTQVGTPYYTSPEQWNDRPYGQKADVWALGCLLYELCALHPPFRANSLEQLGKRVCAGHYTKIPIHYSKELHDIVSRILVVPVHQRPTAAELLELPSVRKHMDTLPKAVLDASGRRAKKIKGKKGSGRVNLMKTLVLPSPRSRHKKPVVLPSAQYDGPGFFADDDDDDDEDNYNNNNNDDDEIDPFAGDDPDDVEVVVPPPRARPARDAEPGYLRPRGARPHDEEESFAGLAKQQQQQQQQQPKKHGRRAGGDNKQRPGRYSPASLANQHHEQQQQQQQQQYGVHAVPDPVDPPGFHSPEHRHPLNTNVPGQYGRQVEQHNNNNNYNQQQQQHYQQQQQRGHGQYDHIYGGGQHQQQHRQQQQQQQQQHRGGNNNPFAQYNVDHNPSAGAPSGQPEHRGRRHVGPPMHEERKPERQQRAAVPYEEVLKREYEHGGAIPVAGGYTPSVVGEPRGHKALMNKDRPGAHVVPVRHANYQHDNNHHSQVNGPPPGMSPYNPLYRDYQRKQRQHMQQQQHLQQQQQQHKDQLRGAGPQAVLAKGAVYKNQPTQRGPEPQKAAKALAPRRVAAANAGNAHPAHAHAAHGGAAGGGGGYNPAEMFDDRGQRLAPRRRSPLQQHGHHDQAAGKAYYHNNHNNHNNHAADQQHQHQHDHEPPQYQQHQHQHQQQQQQPRGYQRANNYGQAASPAPRYGRRSPQAQQAQREQQAGYARPSWWG